ncbi:MAG: phosphoenolpyruvate carboxylase, partial [Saprospiraceae bacterium]
MPTQFQKNAEQFTNDIAIKFQLYNSLFLSLPFVKVEKTGILLSLLLAECEEGYENGLTAIQILESFFSKHTHLADSQACIDLMFRSIQYIERQIVLFDALEDAAYSKINDMNGKGTLKHIENRFLAFNYTDEAKSKLKDFCVRLVLTAHPTQFYPGSVLGIINDLTVSLKSNETEKINELLQQLGKTPFLNRQKPTPYDEAVSLIWFLENVFYHSIGDIIDDYKDRLPFLNNLETPIVKMGFWPGGDRDGNPFVKADTTWRVTTSLHIALLKCYYRDVRKLRRRLTFRGVDEIIIKLESKLYEQAFLRTNQSIKSPEDLLQPLRDIIVVLERDHKGLFQHLVVNLINKIHYFGLHFAFIDIRQENDVHTSLISSLMAVHQPNYLQMNEDQKIDHLLKTDPLTTDMVVDDVHQDTLATVDTIQKIQAEYGEAACNRYIISQCNSALNVIEVLGLFRIKGWNQNVTMDIVPLFETVDDLIKAPEVMEKLYLNKYYKDHLQRRQNRQTIMLGFSDGTKDGGYLMANWMIYKAKEALSKMSAKYGIDVLFFDGRGGPPARGGGKTHKFYASMGKDISTKEIQLTIQGQTISTNFGIKDSARFNLEQLISAGVANNLFSEFKENFTPEEEALVFRIAEISLKSYLDLKNHPNFVPYMTDVCPLKYFGMTNIGSRPAKRGKSDQLTIKDLRAIPFVASWNMVKQNVPGFYGLGTAIAQIKEEGRFDAFQAIYKKSLFVRTLIDNSEMTLYKTFLPLTAHVSEHPVYGVIRKMIADEYHLTKELVLELGNHKELMEEYPVDQMSVLMRERIILPLVTIQ